MTSLVGIKVEKFFTEYPLKQFSAKEIIVHAGDSPPGVMYLHSGEVRQYDIATNGDEVTVNIFKHPAFFPMSWAINNTPNEYFFEAVKDVQLRLCPAEDAVQFLHAHPDVAFDLLSRVYLGLDGILRRTSLLMKGSAYARLLLELIVAGQRFGSRQSTGYLLNITETDLATRVGLTRETISRELKKLQQKNLIEIGHKKIIIKDIQSLEVELLAHK